MSMASLSSFPPPRDFQVLQQELEETVLLLKSTFKPEERTALLRRLRLLLAEADLIMESDDFLS